MNRLLDAILEFVHHRLFFLKMIDLGYKIHIFDTKKTLYTEME